MQPDQDAGYKEITVEQAEALFDAAIQFQYDRGHGDGWREWCPTGRVGDRERNFSPVDMKEWSGVRLRVAVE